MSAPTDVIAGFVSSLQTEVRDVGPGRWVVVLDAAGYALEIDVAVRGRLLRAEAAVLPAGLIDPRQLLFWNRQAPLVCFASDENGDVFVCGELPIGSLDAEMLDRFLGLLLASASRARGFVIRTR